MAFVLDVSALVDMNLMDENDPRFISLVSKTENEPCLITSIVAAQVYHRLKKDISAEFADGILAMMRSRQWITVADTIPLVELAAEAMSFGAVPSIAFTAALARKNETGVVVADAAFDNLEREGFCRLIRY